ncbi:hypothetical protein [Mucilaginibacter auburnensis]|uniref:Uncharacterized protein n=1 Tax=Mucilaginibacter auburnensis TaxID=1457233 RepID=A0A2H9VR97_9SPHI|nr:hypothetical protein [Mucilaginibacter auburnensis]PJJ83341.1 hypothetical protein CLV57_0321 [Mucilaginibacter auburnensis]
MHKKKSFLTVSITRCGAFLNSVCLVNGLLKTFFVILLLLSAKGALAQWNIPATGGNPQWAKIGTFTAGQGGETLMLTAYIHKGYNAANSQDAVYTLTFKTSNGDSVDDKGFAGNGSWYATGQSSDIGPGSIKWKANAAGKLATAYDLYIYLPHFTEKSHYSVTLSPTASWANVGLIGQADPGAASASVLIPTVGFNLIQGNLGVGIADTKGYKFAVNGTAIATSMTVKLSANWPDYVFKSGYKLPTLNEVKRYIDKNHHLPDMPSADEVQNNGLDLGEMNRQLLKKVEELTLYLLDQNKKLDEHQKRMAELEKEIQTLRKQR